MTLIAQNSLSLVKGFNRDIRTYLGTSWKGSYCDEVQDMAMEAFQVLEAKLMHRKEKPKKRRVSEVAGGDVG